jgi:hypothetical protein
MPIAVGDYFDHRACDCCETPPGKNEVFRVKMIQHIIFEVPKSHVHHTMMVCVEVIPL